ncbi:MAG: glutamate-1-semialdehyde 2,1-aminomutase [Candidatus Acidiferrales bacterium]
MTLQSKQTSRSESLYREAEQLLVGGVNSPVRAFKAVGGTPLVIERAEGAYLYDADGKRYLDYIGSWGPMILGHAHPAVTEAIREQAGKGTSYGMSSPLEVELARLICEAMPSVEMVRFVCSGTEATMSAVRLARAFTKRNLILKFEGCYHGHGDSFLSQAGSGLATLGIAASPGVPDELARLTINAPYNNAAAVEKIFAEHGSEIAAVIVEPVAANMGVLPPASGFLQALRELTREHGALLIFDEVITGFRLGYGGAQAVYGVGPDLTTLGKIIGGGLPVGAYGGRRDIMQMVAPLGPMYQAGTLAGNPLAMRAGIETLRQLKTRGFYEALAQKAARLAEGLRAAVGETGVARQVNAVGSLLTLFFNASPVTDYSAAKRSNAQQFARFFHEMLRRGILLPPSQFEAWFVSAAHTDEDIDRTIAACRDSLRAARA